MLNWIRMMLAAVLVALGGLGFGGSIALAGPAEPGDHYDLFGADYARVIATARTIATAITAGDTDLEALDAFGDEIAALAKRLDREGGPHDLACIYRGIVKDLGKKRRELARARGEAASASARMSISALLDDAALVSPTPPEPASAVATP